MTEVRESPWQWAEKNEKALVKRILKLLKTEKGAEFEKRLDRLKERASKAQSIWPKDSPLIRDIQTQFAGSLRVFCHELEKICETGK
jgi:hypothetical protein